MEFKKGISPDFIFYLNNFHLFQNQITFNFLHLIFKDDQEFSVHLHLNFQGKSQDFELFYKKFIVNFSHPIKK